MTDERRALDDEIESWLIDGPRHAPMELAHSIGLDARRTGQRPALAARMLGAPTGTTTASADRRSWLVLAAAFVLGLLAAAVLLGGGSRQPRPLPAEVVASPRPVASSLPATSTPTPTPALPATDRPPNASASPTAAPRLGTVYENPSLGFSLVLDGDYGRPGLMGPLGDGADGTFVVSEGPCVADLCFPAALIGYGSPTDGAVVHRAYGESGKLVDETRVFGRDLAGLEASWIDAFGASSFEDARVDGVNAVIATHGSLVSALFVHHGRIWTISTIRSFLGGVSTAGAVREVMRAFSFSS